MRISQARVSALNIVIISIMVVISILSYLSSLRIQSASSFIVGDTIPVIQATDNLIKDLVDQETGIRGYLISNDRSFLEPYDAGLRQMQTDLAAVAAFAKLHSEALNDLLTSKVIPQIDKIEQFWKEQQSLVQSGKLDEARGRIGNGKQNMDKFRDLQSDMAEIVKGLAHDSYTDANASGQTSRMTLLTGILVSIIAGVFSYLMFRRSARAEKVFRENANELQKHHEATLKLQAEQEVTMQKLMEINEENERQNWLKTHYSRLIGLTQGVTDMKALSSLLISELTKLLEAGQGVFYVRDAEPTSPSYGQYLLLGSYAYVERTNLSNRFSLGEGLVGQCALERKPIILKNVPDDYVHIKSGLGERKPVTIVVHPVEYEKEVSAVIELASFNAFSPMQQELLTQLALALGVILDSVNSRQRTEKLLEEARQLSELLQTQQEELRASNEELEEQTQILKLSEEKLKVQSEELQVINEEMELKTSYLEVQKADIEKQNELIRISKQEVEDKALELEQASKYKSEFLANMSHELRTPLNSLLILSKSLADNGERNLTEDQIESAKIIYSGGLDLLMLINDILDLSKVEAGKLDVHLEKVPVASIIRNLQYQFNHVAQDKGLRFECELADGLPNEIVTDSQRTEQILRNLLSNAFKFTASGKVSIKVTQPVPGAISRNRSRMPEQSISFQVRDTGIGIPLEKQKAIFEAFQQADGATNRKYGGTGLGLTISRELARLLGGEIHLESLEGEGSLFTLILPIVRPEQATAAAEAAVALEPAAIIRSSERFPSGQFVPPFLPDPFIADDREPSDADGLTLEKAVLIIEDDADYAKVLQGIARKKGFKNIVAGDGFSGIRLAKQYVPCAILLDLGLPDMDGLKVLEHLKANERTRSIPIHIISGREVSEDALKRGAVSFLAKPATAEQIETIFSRMDTEEAEQARRILVIEDDAGNQFAIQELLKNKSITISRAYTAQEGLEQLRTAAYDCMILDLDLPDRSGLELLRQLGREREGPIPPVVIYTGRELTQDEYKELNRYTDSIVIKGANSPERLLDEVSLFLHSLPESSSPGRASMIRTIHGTDATLQGRKILLVDDDLRNTFALSKVLKQHGLEVVMADNGKMALDKLDSEPDVQLVLMDIMMPIMDGYEAMHHIRANDRFQTLPIIALTAKAMTGDREKCIEGGANDYMTKPVDTDKLVSLIRVWLSAGQ